MSGLPIVIPATAVEVLREQLESSVMRVDFPERDWLREGRQYLSRERTSLAPAEMVVCLMRRIEELTAAVECRDQLISWLTEEQKAGQE
jgi:hypothetical protein